MTDARVSLIATVLNEGVGLACWLQALEAQTCLPDEAVIVDGGSSDATWEALQRWQPAFAVVTAQLPGANIAQGRNAAIELASGEIIAVTDAGTRAASDWLERLLAPFADPEVDVVAGFFRPRLATRWDRALAATTLPDARELDATRFLPSSRSVAFRRAWFDAGVRYPGWLDYCEDLVWDLTLRRAGARSAWAPDAVVEFVVRPTPRAHARQYFHYARGDGKAGLFARRHALRFGVYGAAAIMLQRRRPRELVLGAMLGLAYIRRPLWRLWTWDRTAGLARSETARAALLVPALRLLGDGAKMAGYPYGLAWRLRRFGALGWRTSWRRISPAGRLWRPAALTSRNRTPTTSPDA